MSHFSVIRNHNLSPITVPWHLATCEPQSDSNFQIFGSTPRSSFHRIGSYVTRKIEALDLALDFHWFLPRIIWKQKQPKTSENLDLNLGHHFIKNPWYKHQNTTRKIADHKQSEYAGSHSAIGIIQHPRQIFSHAATSKFLMILERRSVLEDIFFQFFDKKLSQKSLPKPISMFHFLDAFSLGGCFLRVSVHMRNNTQTLKEKVMQKKQKPYLVEWPGLSYVACISLLKAVS